MINLSVFITFNNLLPGNYLDSTPYYSNNRDKLKILHFYRRSLKFTSKLLQLQLEAEASFINADNSLLSVGHAHSPIGQHK